MRDRLIKAVFYMSCLITGIVLGVTLSSKAGELQNVEPSTQGMAVQPSNTIVLTFRLPEGDMQQFACTPISPGDNTPDNPRNFR